MDANGQRFWLLADDAHWRWRSHVRWDAGCRALQLASERSLPEPDDASAARAAATNALEQVPRAIDGEGALAYWSSEAQAVLARSYLPDDAICLSLPQAPTDLAVTADGVLLVVIAGAVRLHDLRGRWSDVTVEAAGFVAWRLTLAPDGTAWLLERSSGRVARLVGRPLPFDGARDYAGTVFRPSPENCDAPRLEVLPALGYGDNERAVAIACDGAGIPWLLCWRGNQAQSRVRRLRVDGAVLETPLRLAGAQAAYSLAVVDDGRIAVRLAMRREAPVFDPAAADTEARLHPVGEIYPLPDDVLVSPFVHRPRGASDGPPRVPLSLDNGSPGVQALHALSLSNRARSGEARHFDDGGAKLLDSGSAATVWHRLVLEARLPARCGVVAWLATTNEPQPPLADDAGAWLPHLFGDAGVVSDPQVPRAAWESQASELPHHPGLAAWGRETGIAGRWSVLIQNPRRRVRRLVGRYLWVRLVLRGDGRVGPEIAALRAWGERFSYRDRYLPRLYREAVHGAPGQLPGGDLGDIGLEHVATLDAGTASDPALRSALANLEIDPGPNAALTTVDAGSRWLLRAGTRAWRLEADADAIAVYRPQATPADFLERFLTNLEGVLTPLEDRIAHAHLLSDPRVAPQENLDWIGRWIGVAFDAALPEDRRRAWLAAAPELARRHGTRQGLQLALDLATGGGVQGGEIVVIEDFRLRRIAATVLGVDLSETEDPLLPGLIISGNSVVGDTLVLGEAESDALLALFRNDVANDAENAAVLDFLGELAHRATVFVHDAVTPQDLGLIRRIVELESPAHVAVRILVASAPLMVGVASLVGVDTYLTEKPARRPAVLDAAVGGRDYVLGRASVDPRLSGAAAAPVSDPPVADAGADFAAAWGDSFNLDGSASRAAPGRRIDQYRWRLLPDA